MGQVYSLPLLGTLSISRCVNYNATHQVRSPHLTSARCLSRIPVVSLIGRKRKINMMININIDPTRIVSSFKLKSLSCNQIGTLDKLRGEQDELEIHLNNPKRNAKRVR